MSASKLAVEPYAEPLTAKVQLKRLTDANFADFSDLLRFREWREDKPESKDIPLTLAQEMARMTDNPQSGCQIWLIQSLSTGQSVGAITLMPTFHMQCRQLSYWVDPAQHGKGYASEALSQLVRYAFDCTTIVRLQAQVLPENAASIRVLEKAGFAHEVTLAASDLRDGVPTDAHLYGKVKD